MGALSFRQIGDDRGEFYSYTFIENPAQELMMGGGPVCHNANRILPQFQNPQPGEGMIMDSLEVYDVEPGKWLLAAQCSEAGDFVRVWLWHVEPVGTNQTRLLVRGAMRLLPEGGNPVMSTVADLGAFVMEWRMIEGLKLRAEGRTEPTGIEAVEILLWMAALVAGLGAAVLFLTWPAWQAPLLLGLAALFTLNWFTFWQPSIWLRLLFDVALFALLWWVASWVPRVAAATWSEQRQMPGSRVVKARWQETRLSFSQIHNIADTTEDPPAAMAGGEIRQTLVRGLMAIQCSGSLQLWRARPRRPRPKDRLSYRNRWRRCSTRYGWLDTGLAPPCIHRCSWPAARHRHTDGFPPCCRPSR